MRFHTDWKDGFKGNYLRYSIWMISALIFLQPTFIFSYLQYINNIDIQSQHILFVVCAELFVLVGLILLHKRFKDTDSKLRRRIFELLTIEELIKSIGSNFSISSLLKLMLEKAMSVSGSKIGSVFKFEPKKNRFYVVASKGLGRRPEKDFYINIEESLVKGIIVDKKPLLIRNMETDPRMNKINNPKYGPPSFLSMPIFVGKKLFGILNLSCKETKEIFGPSDEKIMAIITSEIGLALENAGLHSKIKKISKAEKKHPEKTVCFDELLGQNISEYKQAGHLSILGEMVENMAHDINYPINSIISFAEILKDRFNERCQDSGILDRIIEEGDRITKIVNSILSFARCKKEEYCPANIRDILYDTLSLVESRLVKNDIKFSVDIPDDLLKVKVRKREIQQVFLDIINNACFALNQRFPKFSEYKFFEIKSDTIEIDNRKHVRTIFCDSGTGISESILDNIWAPFFSTKPKGEGTGLGLAVSRIIIKNHGGDIWVETVENEYTKIVVDLPTYNGWEPMK